MMLVWLDRSVCGLLIGAWVAMYRVEDEKNPTRKKQRFVTLGRYPATSLAEARDLARESLKAAGRGIDPVEAAKQEKLKKASSRTLGQAVSGFLERYVRRHNRSHREIERVFNTYILPRWEDRPLDAISPADIHEVLDQLVDAGHPYMANRVLAHVRKFFNWCKERHWLTDLPTDGIKKPGKEQSRDRILGKDEVQRFWASCDELGWPFGPCFKLLLVTAQRRDEVARMKWSDVNLDDAVWMLPRQQTKSDRQHDVPLSPLALSILESLPHNGDFVFTTTGKSPISGFSKAKARLDGLSEVSAWRLHDLRRTAASGMAEIGIAPHIIEKVLNHSSGQVSGLAAVYNRHTYLREKETALQAWTNQLEQVIGTESRTLNVVSFTSGKR
jgi:integrase